MYTNQDNGCLLTTAAVIYITRPTIIVDLGTGRAVLDTLQLLQIWKKEKKGENV